MSQYSGESGRRADAATVVDAIVGALEAAGIDEPTAADQRALNWDNEKHRRLVRTKFDQNGDFAADEAILPGFGETGNAENARDDCGDPHPFVCDSCGHQVDFGRTCGQSVCGRCAVAWNRDLAIKKSAKIRRVRKEIDYHTAKNEHQKEHHQIISPSLGWYYDLAAAGLTLEEAQKVTKGVVKEILSEMRARGALVRHSYRGADDDGSIKSEDDDQGEWKQRVYSGRNWHNDVRDDLAWKPHYHCIVVSDYLKAVDISEQVEAATGWVIHRISDDRGVSLENDGAMARALTYCISHADIDVRPDGNNRSAIWEVGSFRGDGIGNSSRFSAQPHDLEWADRIVREISGQILGLESGTAECGVTLPAVDDPDELARRVLEELYPDDDRRDDVPEDVVLHHVVEGNIGVEVETSSGGGGSVNVTDAFGEPIGSDGFGGGNLPTPPKTPTVEAADAPIETLAVDGDQEECDGDECSCTQNDQADDQADRCDGTLTPLGAVRERGLLEDEEWCQQAPHVDEAREADEEWPDDLERWRSTVPAEVKAVGMG